MDDERGPLLVHEAMAAPVCDTDWLGAVEVVLDDPDPLPAALDDPDLLPVALDEPDLPLAAADPEGDAALK
jgi:hypothetical protein